MTTTRLPALLSLCAFLTALHTAPAAPPSASDFVKWPEISSVTISEDGRYVAFLTPTQKRYFDFNLYDLQTKTTRKLALGGDEVLSYQWTDANHLILNTENPPNYWWRQQLFDVSQNKVVANVSHNLQYFQLVSSLRRDPYLFVVRFYEEFSHSGARQGLAIINSKRHPTKLAGQFNPRFNVKEWIELPEGEHHNTFTDQEGEVRLVTIYRNKQMEHHYRTGADAPWKLLPFDYETTDVLGFPDDPDLIFVSHYAAESHTSRLHQYRVSTQEFGPPIFEDPDYSLSEARILQIRSPDRSRPLALGYQRDLYAQRAVDPRFAEVQKSVNESIPGRLNVITGCDYHLRRFVVASMSGREPARFAIYDHTDRSLLPLPAPAPWLNPAAMSIQRPVKFTARDGLVLEGYLSLPAPAADGRKPPLVVNPHGGPWVRDTWGYDPDVQFLTTRGYAVFQPNYRGSPGYSRAVSKTDEWDFRKMHDDVTDGVRHIVKMGVVDEKRIVIFGGSFGGYLAVAGVAFEPGLYRCGVTFAGVFDWEQLLRQTRVNRRYNEFNYDLLLKKLGDPKKQQERFEAMSPIAHVAAIKAPVLVVHGKLDGTVDYRQSTKLLSELKQHKIPHEKLFFDTEFHGLSEQKNRQKFLEAVERFLAKHL
jgi:dipeptidyl aminopeptidase/acylaminoacyl peptidase